MNKILICNVRGVFTGIYAWGEGWTQEKASAWNNWLEEYKGSYWKPVKINGTWYLVGINGSIFLHPMDFNTVLKSCGGRCPKGNDDVLEDYFGEELAELKKICTELAESCGGKFTSMVAEAQKIDNNNLRSL